MWFLGVACIWSSLSGQTSGMAETVLVTSLGFGMLWIAHQLFPYQRLTFNKKTGLFTRVVARLNGRKITSHALSNIERAAIEAQWSEGTRMERLALVINGEKHPLEFGFYGTSRGGLVKKINTWLAEA